MGGSSGMQANMAHICFEALFEYVTPSANKTKVSAFSLYSYLDPLIKSLSVLFLHLPIFNLL